jgi:mercuric ion transport protein
MATGIKRAFLLVTGAITCPCHLPFVLPALAAGLAGTAVGAFIGDNTGLLITLATIYFFGVVIYFLRRRTTRGTERPSEGLEH